MSRCGGDPRLNVSQSSSWRKVWAGAEGADDGTVSGGSLLDYNSFEVADDRAKLSSSNLIESGSLVPAL